MCETGDCRCRSTNPAAEKQVGIDHIQEVVSWTGRKSVQVHVRTLLAESLKASNSSACVFLVRVPLGLSN